MAEINNEEKTPVDEMEQTAADTTEEVVEEATQENPEAAEDAESAEKAEPSDDTEASAEDEAEATEPKQEKASGKVKKDKKDEKIEELTDRLKRQMAEFENFRKRSEREKAGMYDMGASDVILKMLDVVDNFERGLKDADTSDPFADGMSKIYKQMITVLTDLGVTPIEAEGAEFDPNLHNAVMHEDNPDVGDNIVTAELQKGYKYKDSVVRHSMVKVAN